MSCTAMGELTLISTEKGDPIEGVGRGDVKPSLIALYPGLLTPVFVTCSTNMGEGLQFGNGHACTFAWS